MNHCKTCGKIVKITFCRKCYNKKFFKTKNYLLYRKEAKKSPKYKEWVKKYHKTKKYKEWKSKYIKSEKYKEWKRKYRLSPKYLKYKKTKKYKEWVIKYNCHRRRRYSIEFTLRKAQQIRGMLRGVLKNNYRNSKIFKLLDCDLNFLRKYLEERFKEGMNWDNYGIWSVDHIIPLSKFDLSDNEQLLKACNYKNIQPLWNIDNIKKKDKIL